MKISSATGAKFLFIDVNNVGGETNTQRACVRAPVVLSAVATAFFFFNETLQGPPLSITSPANDPVLRRRVRRCACATGDQDATCGQDDAGDKESGSQA